jgi:hypothetical protein
MATVSSVVGIRRSAGRCSQFVGQGTAQLGPDEAADLDPLALAREFDQGTVAVGRLDANPCRHELDVIGVATERALDRQPARRQHHPLAVAGVTRIQEQRGSEGEQLDARERQYQRRTVQPEGAGDDRRKGAEREVEDDQLRWRHRAVAAQQPLQRAVFAVAGGGSEAQRRAGRAEAVERPSTES